jgi:hypothetical protein
MNNDIRLYEHLGLPKAPTEPVASRILRFFKQLAAGILIFVILIAIIYGITQLGWSLGWQHNSLFLAACRGAILGSVGGAYWASRELFKKKG